MKRARQQIERELALIEKLDLAGIFPDCLGHRALLPRAETFWCRGAARRPIARSAIALGITAVDPVEMELAFRAFSFRRARRMAGHRSRSAQRRSARARDSICVRTLRKIGRGDDRQRDHLSRDDRRRAKSARRSRSMPETLDRLAALVGSWEYQGCRTTRSSANFSDAGLDLSIRASGNFSSCARHGAGFAAASWAAFGRDGGVPGAARFGGAAGAGDDAGTRGGAMG